MEEKNVVKPFTKPKRVKKVIGSIHKIFKLSIEKNRTDHPAMGKFLCPSSNTQSRN